MRKTLIVFFFCFCIGGVCEEFNFQNRVFELLPLGSKHVIYQKTIHTNALDTKVLKENNCQEIIDTILTYQKTAEYCQKRPSARRCRDASNFISFISKEEHYQRPEIVYPIERNWQIDPIFSDINSDLLLKYVAKRFLLDKQNLIYSNERDKFRLTDNIEVNHLFGSTSKIIDQFGFVQEIELDNFKITNNLLSVNNRYLACDLKNKQLELRGKYLYTFSYLESVASKNLEKLWLIYTSIVQKLDSDEYKNTTSLVKASLIGRDMWQAMQKNNLNIKKFPLTFLLDKFFDLSTMTPFLKIYSSLNDLKTAEFPDQNHHLQVEVPWSLSK